MRVVVAAKAAPRKARSTSLVNYIARSKIKAEAERLNGKERFLFGELGLFADKDEAERFLSENNPMGDSPLSQIVISFDAEQLQQIEENVESQDELIREAVREAMAEAKEELEKKLGQKIEELRWAAAIHRNTDNPHVHLVVSRYLIAEDGQPIELKHVPREWLPHKRETETAQKELVAGAIAKAIIAVCRRALEQKEERAKTVKAEPQNIAVEEATTRRWTSVAETVTPMTQAKTQATAQTVQVAAVASGARTFQPAAWGSMQNEPIGRDGGRSVETDASGPAERELAPVSADQRAPVGDRKGDIVVVSRYIRALYRGDREAARAYARRLPTKTLDDIHRRLAARIEECGERFAALLYHREDFFHEEVSNFRPSENSRSLVELRDVEIERRASIGARYDQLLHPTGWLEALAKELPHELSAYKPAIARIRQNEEQCDRRRELLLKKVPKIAAAALLSAHTLAEVNPKRQTETAKTVAEKIIKKHVLGGESRAVTQAVKRHLSENEARDLKRFFATLHEATRTLRRTTADADAKAALLLKLYAKERQLAERAQETERPYLFHTIRLSNGHEIMIAKLIHKEEKHSALRRMVTAHLLKSKNYNQSRLERIADLRGELEAIWNAQLSKLFTEKEENARSNRWATLKTLRQMERTLVKQSLPKAESMALAERYFAATANWIEWLQNMAQTYSAKAEKLAKIEAKRTETIAKTAKIKAQNPASNETKNGTNVAIKTAHKAELLREKAENCRRLANQLHSRALFVAAAFELNQLRFYDSACRQLMDRTFQPVVVGKTLVNLKDLKAETRAAQDQKKLNTSLNAFAARLQTFVKKAASPLKSSLQTALRQTSLKAGTNDFAARFQTLLKGVTSALKSGIQAARQIDGGLNEKRAVIKYVHEIHDQNRRQIDEKLNSLKGLSEIAARYGFQPNPERLSQAVKTSAPGKLKEIENLVRAAHTAARYNHTLAHLFPNQTRLALNCCQLLTERLAPGPENGPERGEIRPMAIPDGYRDRDEISGKVHLLAR